MCILDDGEEVRWSKKHRKSLGQQTFVEELQERSPDEFEPPKVGEVMKNGAVVQLQRDFMVIETRFLWLCQQVESHRRITVCG